MRVAVYSGSFDPLHTGHLAIMKYLSGCGKFDQVRLVISPQSPFKSPNKALNARQRYQNACKAVEKYPDLNVKVDDLELSMPAPHYTIHTLDALKAAEPENEFTLIIGADNFAAFKRWKGHERILTEYAVSVYPRTGYDMAAAKASLEKEALASGAEYHIHLIDASLHDISSTFIREAELRGENVSGYLM